jgi:hypothetical protein
MLTMHNFGKKLTRDYKQIGNKIWTAAEPEDRVRIVRKIFARARLRRKLLVCRIPTFAPTVAPKVAIGNTS